MPVNFETRTFATITMLNDVAETMLKMMGQSGHVPGAINAEDVPAALARLKQASAYSGAPAKTGGNTAGNDDDEKPVSARHRALPLIDLLEAAARESDSVVWKQG